MTTVSLEGIQSGITDEDRAIAILKVEHNGQTYDWKVFIPAGSDLTAFIGSCSTRMGLEIDAKEAEWAALTPKTRETKDLFTNEVLVVAIEKSEVVYPDIPDYYAKRRAAYPALGDQLDAQWKGGSVSTAMQDKIQSVKNKYPKPVWLA